MHAAMSCWSLLQGPPSSMSPTNASWGRASSPAGRTPSNKHMWGLGPETMPTKQSVHGHESSDVRSRRQRVDQVSSAIAGPETFEQHYPRGVAGLSWQDCSVGSHVGPMAKRVVLREVPESVHMRLTTRVAVLRFGLALLKHSRAGGSATPCPNRRQEARPRRAPTLKQPPTIARAK